MVVFAALEISPTNYLHNLLEYLFVRNLYISSLRYISSHLQRAFERDIQNYILKILMLLVKVYM